jgi:putative tryptophan/tyrosine transport system substrate-binding protein
MAYGSDPVDRLLQGRVLVYRILRGAKVGELPVEFPTKYELVINLKTAKAIGLTIPEALLPRADEVIE